MISVCAHFGGDLTSELSTDVIILPHNTSQSPLIWEVLLWATEEEMQRSDTFPQHFTDIRLTVVALTGLDLHRVEIWIWQHNEPKAVPSYWRVGGKGAMQLKTWQKIDHLHTGGTIKPVQKKKTNEECKGKGDVLSKQGKVFAMEFVLITCHLSGASTHSLRISTTLRKPNKVSIT